MYMKEVQVWVKVVPGSARTVGAGADLWFLGRQPTSDASHVHRCTPLAATASTVLRARGYPPSGRSPLPVGRLAAW